MSLLKIDPLFIPRLKKKKATDKVLTVGAPRGESQVDVAPFTVLFPEKTPFPVTL